MIWKDFLEDVLQQRYVLILGNEIMLKEEYAGGDSDKYIRKKYRNRSDDKEDQSYKEFVVETKIDESHFNDKLRELLEMKIFRVIITTTVDDLLERILQKIWGNDLQVLNFYGEKNNDWCKEPKRNEFYETSPTLYYAFGKAESGSTFVSEEDDKLRTVAEWLDQNRNGFPSKIYSFLRSKKLLALGCKQHDWLFRFFWYSLRKDVISLNNATLQEHEESKGKVAIELDENDPLRYYLKRKGWLYDNNDKNKLPGYNNAMGFIDDFLKSLLICKENDNLGHLLHNNSLGGCFISYASEDFHFAMRLYLSLRERGFSVWIDHEKLLPGADYEERIENAIKECKVFLPILSGTILHDYECGKFSKPDDEKRYYLREWDIMMNRVQSKGGFKGEKPTIIPVLCEGFDLNSEAYRSLPWFGIADRTVFKKEEESLLRLIKGIEDLKL